MIPILPTGIRISGMLKPTPAVLFIGRVADGILYRRTTYQDTGIHLPGVNVSPFFLFYCPVLIRKETLNCGDLSEN